MTFADYEVAADAAPIHEHHHRQEEVWNVVDGEIAISIDGDERVLGPGAAAVAPANAPHSARAVKAARAIVADYPLRLELPGQAHRICVTAARAANLGLKFVLELCMLGALAYWGAQAGGSVLVDVVLAVGAPLAAAIVWGVFAAPRAQRRLPRGPRLALELAVFAVAAVALAATGATVLAVVFAALVAVNTALLVIWGDADA